MARTLKTAAVSTPAAVVTVKRDGTVTRKGARVLRDLGVTAVGQETSYRAAKLRATKAGVSVTFVKATDEASTYTVPRRVKVSA